MEYKGKIKKIMEEVKINEKFRKREFVLSDEAQSYPQTPVFEMQNDRCDLLNNFKEGDEVKIDFNIGGREWTNPQGEVKYFNTLKAFRIFPAKTESGKPETAKSEPKKQQPPVRQVAQESNETLAPTPDDDLPF